MFTYRDYYDVVTSIATDEVKLYLRHDVDISLKKALEMAEREAKMKIGPAIYFILPSSEYYNVLEKQNIEYINKILNLGHRIGLHYDLSTMPLEDEFRSRQMVMQVQLLEETFNTHITDLAAHKPFMGIKPSQALIDAMICVGLNEVSDKLQHYKYISDSGMNFREDPFEVSKYHKLVHLNIHPEWWDTKEGNFQERLYDLNLERDVQEKVYNEIKSLKRYHAALKQSNNRL